MVCVFSIVYLPFFTSFEMSYVKLAFPLVMDIKDLEEKTKVDLILKQCRIDHHSYNSKCLTWNTELASGLRISTNCIENESDWTFNTQGKTPIGIIDLNSIFAVVYVEKRKAARTISSSLAKYCRYESWRHIVEHTGPLSSPPSLWFLRK